MLCCAPDDKRLDSFETCRADKKLWNEIDYKNCASRWLLTHYNMIHSAHNVTLIIKVWIVFYSRHSRTVV